jgi:hypothetical protein
MKNTFAQRLRCFSVTMMLVFALLPSAQAEPTTVRYLQGTFHGFVELRSEDGHVVASGDSAQVVHGDRITAETVFRFRDGSVDDETAVYTQHRTFQLVSYHHIQKGPFFPHPMEMTIDVHSGQVTVRTTGKDGKAEVDNEHLNLPPDLANGIVPVVIENMRTDLPGTTASMVVLTPKPRVVKLDVSPAGEEDCSIGGVVRKATHYEIKIELGGIVGIVAPLIGKAPPTIQIWVIKGQAPTFARDQAPLYAEGPVMTVQLASPVWPETAKPGH